jgi:hypothetical protein
MGRSLVSAFRSKMAPVIPEVVQWDHVLEQILAISSAVASQIYLVPRVNICPLPVFAPESCCADSLVTSEESIIKQIFDGVL